MSFAQRYRPPIVCLDGANVVDTVFVERALEEGKQEFQRIVPLLTTVSSNLTASSLEHSKRILSLPAFSLFAAKLLLAGLKNVGGSAAVRDLGVCPGNAAKKYSQKNRNYVFVRLVH